MFFDFYSNFIFFPHIVLLLWLYWNRKLNFVLNWMTVKLVLTITIVEFIWRDLLPLFPAHRIIKFYFQEISKSHLKIIFLNNVSIKPPTKVNFCHQEASQITIIGVKTPNYKRTKEKNYTSINNTQM